MCIRDRNYTITVSPSVQSRESVFYTTNTSFSLAVLRGVEYALRIFATNCIGNSDTTTFNVISKYIFAVVWKSLKHFSSCIYSYNVTWAHIVKWSLCTSHAWPFHVHQSIAEIQNVDRIHVHVYCVSLWIKGHACVLTNYHKPYLTLGACAGVTVVMVCVCVCVSVCPRASCYMPRL